MTQRISEIKKRDGSIVLFEEDKIANAIYKAAKSVHGSDMEEPKRLARIVAEELEKYTEGIPTVEQVQDLVEQVLIKEGHAKTAKAYIVYRQKRAELREQKMKLLEKDYLDEVDKRFDVNALRVLKARYLKKDERGKLTETPKQLFTRVAVHAALPDIFYDSKVYDIQGKQNIYEMEEFDPKEYDMKLSIGKYKLNQFHMEGARRIYERYNKDKKMKVSWSQLLELFEERYFDKYEKSINDFFNLMVEKKFMPNTPAIANFGNKLGMGSACFVLGIEDSMESIMETLKNTAIIHKSGGGTGFNFTNIRPEGDYVSSTSGVASGPLSFMKLFDTMTEVVKQGGIRRGANMGILNSNHPDIEKFITSKDGNKGLRNFNISVLIMPEFWECLGEGKPYPLVNPRNGEIVRVVDPKALFDKIVYQAWESAEPGVIFYDTVNKYNPFFEHLGPIVTTNPCVSADTLVSTESGLERIDSIKSNEIFVDARAVENNNYPLVTLQNGVQKVKMLRNIKTGYKETLRLETNSGYELIATPDHKVLTENGWKQLSELTDEDKILIQSGAGSFNKNSKLPFEVNNTIIGENGRKYMLNLPTEWSKELGLVLGWITGDGWLNKKFNQIGLVFSKQDKDAKEVIKPIFESYCNREVSELKYKNSCIQIRSSSKHVVDFFSKLGIKSIDKEVPELIFTATEEAVVGFLQGLFSSDGTIGMGSESRNYARLNSSSLKLLKQVQVLLLNLGIRSSIYNRFTKPKKFTYVGKDGKEVEYKTSGINYELNISKENLQRFFDRVGFIQKRHNQRISEIEKFEFYKEYFVDKVRLIENAGKREVWDITEPITHSFIANGIVVHNCGEVLLYPNEPCNLGSINVWAFTKEDGSGNVYYDWNGLKEAVHKCTRFLDNVIDINKFPLKAIEEMSLSTRKIGLGVMGLGDLLYELRLAYNTEEGRKFMEKLMQFIAYNSKIESIELAHTRGNLPFFDKSFYKEGRLPFLGFELEGEWDFDWKKVSEDVKRFGIRNGYTTIIAPTGSISMIAGCSSGMEPVYSLAFEKNVKVGSFYYVDPAFEKALKKEEMHNDEIMQKICDNKGSAQGLEDFPAKLQKVFVTALDITPEDHIRALASFQKWVDSSISKTNNFPADATIEHMKDSYMLAYKLGCKDVTVFRDSSIKDQVLVAPKKKEEKKEGVIAQETHVSEKAHEIENMAAEKEIGDSSLLMKSEGKRHKKCPECGAETQLQEGCVSCKGCGWALCK